MEQDQQRSSPSPPPAELPGKGDCSSGAQSIFKLLTVIISNYFHTLYDFLKFIDHEEENLSNYKNHKIEIYFCLPLHIDISIYQIYNIICFRKKFKFRFLNYLL
jgi:hypothetical protein